MNGWRSPYETASLSLWGSMSRGLDMEKKKKTKRKYGNRRKQVRIRKTILFLSIAFVCITVIALVYKKHISHKSGKEMAEVLSEEDWIGAPELDVQLLEPNEYSRPGIPLPEVKGIVIHYVANPGSSAQANRNYFESLKDTHTTKASSHFVVGLDGEIIQCIPSSEISYASNDRNEDTISIECCHPDESGKFKQETYTSVVQLTAWLCTRFHLNSQDVIRHYDVTGKLCPKYYVENEDAWVTFLADVENKIAEIQSMK